MQTIHEHSTMRRVRLAAALCTGVLLLPGAVFAQQMSNPYGLNINLAAAKKVAAAACPAAHRYRTGRWPAPPQRW